MSREVRLLFEVYGDRFDPGAWGGIETAQWYLMRALEAVGARVDTVDREALGDPGAAEACVIERGADAFLPLVDGSTFARPDPLRWPRTSRAMLRIWHDVSRIADAHGRLPACPVHDPGSSHAGAGACPAAAVGAELPVANVFLRPEPWTRCFARRHIVPWSTSHVPALDLRDADGPVVLLLGKVEPEEGERMLDALLAAGRAVRAVFCSWSRMGRTTRERLAARRDQARLELVPTYRIERDYARVFGGASCLVAASRFHETFNFLAAEAVQLGIPVMGLRRSGATSYFASAELDDVDALAAFVAEGRDRLVAPRPRSDTSWEDVGRRYLELAIACREPALHAHAASPA